MLSVDRSKLLNTLGKMCSRFNTVPDSIRIETYFDSQMHEYGGGCATVSRGDYRGRAVAIKTLHLYVTSNLEGCFNVSDQLKDDSRRDRTHYGTTRDSAGK